MNTENHGFIRTFNGKSRIFEFTLDGFSIGLGLWMDVVFQHVLWQDGFLWTLILATAIFMVFAEYNELYGQLQSNSCLRKSRLAAVCWASVILLLLLIDTLFNVFPGVSHWILIPWSLTTAVLLAGWRCVFCIFWKLTARFGNKRRNVAIVGATSMAATLAETIQKDNWRGERLVGIYDDRTPSDNRVHLPTDVEFLGNFNDMVADAKILKLDVIYFTLPLRAESRIYEQTNKLADTTASVYIVPDFSPFKLLNSRWMTVNNISLVSIYESPFMQYFGIDDFLKRMFDIIVSSVFLLLLAVPMAAIAIGVKVSSPGPVIFRQKRYGIDGREIKIWKFRSMYVCEDGEKSIQATKDDPRITVLGRYLRKYSLDELPQLFNVLLGDMSIVGPRPHSVARNEQFRTRILGYMLRHKVKPGITGLAQVYGYRGETDTLEKMEQRVRHDLEYMENWSLGLDFKILIMTVIRCAWIERIA